MSELVNNKTNKRLEKTNITITHKRKLPKGNVDGIKSAAKMRRGRPLRVPGQGWGLDPL